MNDQENISSYENEFEIILKDHDDDESNNRCWKWIWILHGFRKVWVISVHVVFSLILHGFRKVWVISVHVAERILNTEDLWVTFMI
jgi:hypothetical protein